MSSLSMQLQTHRLAMALTQRELSERAGVAYSTLRKLETTGKGSISDYVKLLKALRMQSQLAALGLDAAAHEPFIAPHRRVRKRRPVEQDLATPASSLPSSGSQPNTVLLKQSSGLKSERLGLSFPYDWSNPDIEDDVLIAKVLDKARFDDVSRTIAYFGLARVELVAQRFGIALDCGPLGAILPAIRKVHPAQSLVSK